MHKLLLQTSTMVSSLLIASTASWAQAPAADDAVLSLEEIVVTAERRSEDLQKTAVSVTVRNGDDMLDQGRLSVGDYLADVAGVSGTPDATSLNNPFANVTVRGVISNSPGDGSQVPTTAAYTDGVYEGLGSNYDVVGVQVLRGPQGTLYGRSATGGVIAIQTRNPELGEFSGNAAYTYGSYELRNAQAAINVPLGDAFAVRIAGMTNEQDGYLSDLSSTQKAVRIKAMFKPSDELSILVGAAMQNNMRQTGGNSYTLATYDDPAVAGTATYTLNKDRARQYWAEINWDMGPATLTYLPAYRYNDYDPIKSYVGPAGMAVGYNPSETPVDKFLTHEVRLASNPGSAFKWIVGSFYYNSVWENNAYLRWLASGALAFSNDQRRVRTDYGVFGETTFDLSDTLRLTTGLRYDYNSSEHTEVSTSNLTTGAGGPPSPTFGLPENLLVYTLGSDAGSRTHRNLTYKLRVEKDLSDVNMVYATLSSGFLPGDVQVGTDANRNPIAKPYDQETLNGLELGSKNRFLDETLQLNTSVYYYDYTGYQVDVQPTPWIPGALHLTVTSAARMYGLDLDATYLLTKNDQVSMTAGLIDAKFKDSSNEFKSFVAQKKIAGIAPVTLTAAYEHTFPFANGSAIKARVDGRYNAAYDLVVANPAFTPSTANPTGLTVAQQLRYSQLGAQVTGNASVNWSSPDGKYGVGGYVRNFTDNVYKTNLNIQYNGSVDGSPSVGRTVGVTARMNF